MSEFCEKLGNNQNDTLKTSEEENLKIYSVTWSPEDRIVELEQILQGASAESVDEQFVKYIIENIEPVGWRAVWRSRGRTVFSHQLNQAVDFMVDVVHVSQEKLKALVTVIDLVNADTSEEMKLLEKNVTDQNISVPLTELYPVAYQENQAINIEETSEVIEQVRFFFENIWQPWDLFEELCCYDKYLISNRMQIYEEIRKEIIPRTVSSEMKSLKVKARETASKIHDLEIKSGIASETEVDQRDLVQLMKLNKEIEQLKTRYDSLRDPALRELTVHQEQLERRDILASFLSEEPANILVVVSSVLVEDFIRNISKLPDMLEGLPQGANMSRVKTFPSMQMALDSAQVNDVIALLPGVHLLKHLGSIARGGTLCGLGEGVEIVGCLSTGDVLLDLDLLEDQRFVLQSVVLRPLEEQTAVSLHKGSMLIHHCCIKGGSVGVSLLSESECRVEQSTLISAERFGIECKSESKLFVSHSKFEKLNEAALKGEEGAKITFTDDVLISDCSNGISLSGHAEGDKNSEDPNFQEDLKKKILLAEDLVKFENTDRSYTFALMDT